MAQVMRVSKCELRRDIRFATAFRATLRADGEPRGVVIGDISSSGALIKGKLLPAVGARIQLVARALLVGGRVMWRREGLAGVCFDSPVSPLHIVRENSDYFNSYRERRARRTDLKATNNVVAMRGRCHAV